MKTLPKTKPSDAATQELYKLLLKSEKFIKWKPKRVEQHEEGGDGLFEISFMAEVIAKHFTPLELAEAWGVSTETIRQIFREEPGVLKIGKPVSFSF